MFHRLALTVLLFAVPAAVFAAEQPVTRKDGFLLIWKSIARPAEQVSKQVFSDVAPGSASFTEITYAERRGILDEEEKFWPDHPLELEDALLWLFRTRSVDSVTEITHETLPTYLAKYPIANFEGHERTQLSEQDLLALMASFDAKLRDEIHEVSNYSEKFHGKGTAFGETFDMYAMTAAHKYFPHNTLVEVTNLDNGKSVTVRINDRGPFVEGRDMDLSLGSFLVLSPRSAGVLRNVTFKRLGDANLVGGCSQTVRQQRITRDVRLLPGVPRITRLGEQVSWSSQQPYLLERITYPDGNAVRLLDWMQPEESYSLTPSVAGTYVFTLKTASGRGRDLTMNVVDCTGL